MAMIVQLILMIRRVCVGDHDGVVSAIVLLAGEGSSTIADDATTGGGDNQTMLMSYYHHRRRHLRNNQPRTISTSKKGTYACVTDYHPQYKQLCNVHCINIVFSSKFGGVGWGTLSPDDVPASDPTYDNTNTILKIQQFTPAS